MRTWRYHKDFPAGRIFETDNPGEVEDAEADGWVDTPAKLDKTYQVEKTVSTEDYSILLSKIEALELANIDLAKTIMAREEEIEALKNPPNEATEKTLQQKFDDGDDLTQSELVNLARNLGINAFRFWKPETIAQKIREKS